MTYGVQCFDKQGRKTIGFDNPSALIDVFTGPPQSISPPQVNGGTVNYGRGVKTYTLRPGAIALAVATVAFPTVNNTYGNVMYLVYEIY